MADKSQREPNFGPLSPIALQVLISLAEGDKHGYAIIKDIRRRTSDQLKPGASTLYSVLRRLLDEGLVAEARSRPEFALDDERRRYFSLSSRGRHAALEELQRMETVLDRGRSKRLLLGHRGA